MKIADAAANSGDETVPMIVNGTTFIVENMEVIIVYIDWAVFSTWSNIIASAINFSFNESGSSSNADCLYDVPRPHVFTLEKARSMKPSLIFDVPTLVKLRRVIMDTFTLLRIFRLDFTYLLA
jgi:hypothetical protein